jgi:CsoR family transcriptional regulator, copper-sensing transcriptional repressor
MAAHFPRMEEFVMECSDRSQVLNLLKTSKGQMEGIIKMVEDDRYCVDISKQLLAVQAQLKKVNLKIIDQHIKHCVKQAFTEGRGDEKVDEIIELLDKYAK